MPKVSVIIPVYNTEQFLRECLDSVINQTLKDIEIICVDDGSTDNSVQILNEYAQKYNYVKVLTQENKYAGVARNYGMSVASGEFCAFLDSDDCYLEDALEVLYNAAVTHNLDMVKGNFYIFNQDTSIHSTSPYSLNASVPDYFKNKVIKFDDAPEALIYATDVPWNGLYRMSFIREHEIKFNSLRCVNDHSFFVHCLILANRIMIINQFTTYYRYGQSNSLIGTKANHFENQFESFRIVKNLTSALPKVQKQIIFEREFDAIAGWYVKLIDASETPNAINEQMNLFINHEFKDTYVRAGFWDTYRYADVYYKFKKSKFPLLRKIRGFIRCCQTRGVGYTLTYSAQKVLFRFVKPRSEVAASAPVIEHKSESEVVHK